MLLAARSPTCSSRASGIWGINIPVGWGFADHQLRLVDRHRPRRHADLGDPAAVQAGLAHLDQPVRRGHDALRRRLRRALPADPHRAGRGWLLLAVPVPEHDGRLAAVPQPAHLGRVRGLDLRHGVAAVLVHRPDPRPGDAARQDARTRCSRRSTASSRSAGAARRGTGSATRRAYLLLAGLATPLVLSVHTVVSFDFAVAILPGLAHDDLPALLRRRRHLRRLRHGAHAGHPAARRSTAWRTSSPCATSRTWRKVMLATGLIVVYGYGSRRSSPGTAATRTSTFMI